MTKSRKELDVKQLEKYHEWKGTVNSDL